MSDSATRWFDVTLAEAGGRSGHRVRPRRVVLGGRRIAWIVTIIGIMVWTGVELGIGRRALVNGSGFTELLKFVRASYQPAVSLELGRTVFRSTVITLAYAVLGTIFSVFGGLLFGVLSTRARHDHLRLSAVGKVLRTLAIPVRGTHEALWALLLVNILGINPLVAIIAIALPFGAVSMRVFAELFEAQTREPFDSLRASGATRWQAFFYGVFPSAARDLGSYSFYRFECAIRASAVLGIVGAAGLGQQIFLSSLEPNYREMWTFIWPLIALSACADAVSSMLRRSANGPSNRFRQAIRRPSVWLVTMALTATVAWWSLGVSPSTLWAERARKEFGFVRRNFLPPEFSTDHLKILWPAARQTVAISIGSIIVSLIAALPFALLSARVADQRRTRRATSWLGRTVLLIARSIPPAVWAFLAVLVLFPGPLPAAIALGIYNAGVLGRLLAEVVENLDHRPRRALRAAGASPLAANAYATLPQAAPSFATYSLYRWEVAMRETIVVGVAAAGGLGAHIKQVMAAFAYDKLVAAVIVLLIITAIVDLLSSTFRRKLLA
jgi:phosphonate transport system permease protein